jgi:peroxiredoxin
MGRLILVTSGVLALAATGLSAAPAPKAKPAPLSAAAVLAKLKKDDQAVKTGRVTLLALQRTADLPDGTKGPKAAREEVSKAPLGAQRREYLVFSGADYKRDITVMDRTGNVETQVLLGERAKVGRIIQSTGHAAQATRQAVIGVTAEQNAADRVLFNRGSDLLDGVKWKSVKPLGKQLELNGARGDERVTLTLRTTPTYAIDKLAVSETVSTPAGSATRGQELAVVYAGVKPALKSVEHLIYLTGAINRAALTTYKVEGIQHNQAIGADELSVAIPAGTKVLDRRVEPPARYAQGEKDLTLAEVKALSENAGATKPKVGKAAPDWELKTLDGKALKVSGHKGRVVLLTWFACWCGPCHAEAPIMEKEIWQKYQAKGLTVVGVNAGERDDPQKAAQGFVGRHTLTYPVAMDVDNAVSELYEIQAFPTIVVIDRKGVLRYMQAGFDHQGVVALLEKLLAEE